MKKKLSYILIFILMIFITSKNAFADDLLGNPYINITFDPVAKENTGHGTLKVFSSTEEGNYRNSSVTYGFDDYGTYMEWTAGTSRGGGFNLNLDKAIGKEYTIALKFSFTNTGEISGGWKKIIDFQKTGSQADSGLYFYNNGKTQFYPKASQGPNIKNNEVVDLLIRRNKETNKFEVYNRVGDKSILCYEFTDTDGLSILDTGLGFFHDDYATSSESSPGGKVYSVKIWDTWTSVNDVWDYLDEEQAAVVYYYKYFNGSNETLSYEGTEDFSFTVDGDPLLLDKVTIGGITFERNTDYTLSRKNGTKITFTEEGLKKLNTLTKGTYEVTVAYTNEEEVKGEIVLENGPAHVAVESDDKTEFYYEGKSSNEDETLTYDSDNHTLTLSNYEGGPISYYSEEDLTIILEGENTITSDDNEIGIETINSGLTIEGNGSLEIINVKSGIVAEKDVTIEETNIEIEASTYGIYCNDSLKINAENLEITTNNDGSGVAILVVTDENNSLNISNKIVIDAENVTAKKVLAGPNDTNIVTLGNDDASVTLETNEEPLNAKNVLSSVRMHSKKTVTFNTNGGTGSMNQTDIDTENDELPECTLIAPDGMEFAGWSLTNNGNILTSSSEITSDSILYAIWKKAYDYKFLEGDNQKLTKDEFNEYTFRIDGDYSLFESVTIGNLELIKDEDYTVTEGSTIITFLKEGIAKLNKLKKGEYKIKVNYTNGKVVEGKVFLLRPNIDNPKTLDNISTYITTLAISLLLLISSVYLKKYKKI